MFSDLYIRIRALIRQRTVERELADELRFHLEQEIDRHVAAGMTRAAAARRAHLDFGGVERIAEECRDARGISLVDSVLQDLRYGARTMRRSPTFAFVAITTIALATAAITTVGSLADTLLWRDLPVEGASRIITVHATRGRPGGDGVVSYPDYIAFRDRATTVTGLAAHYSTAPLFVSVGGSAKEINGAVVSASYFPLLRLQPALGRFFSDEEDRVPDRDRVAVLGYEFWQSSFGGAAVAVGSSLTINGAPFTVIGVAPPRPGALTPMPVQLYIPTMVLRVGYRWCKDSLAVDCPILGMIGRLAPERTIQDAAAEFAAIMPDAWKNAPVGQNRGVQVRRPRGMPDDDQEPRLIAMLGGVAIVLLIVCCANVGGLLGAQSMARQAEFGVRVALGAAPRRIIRQVLTESLLLACLGGAAGLLVSRGFTGALSRLFFSMDDEGHPLFYDFRQSPAVVAMTFAAAVAAGVLFSVVPAMRAVRHAGPGRMPGRLSGRRWSTSRWLLAAQAAAAVAMLATAALFAFSARAIVEGRNYDSSHVALMRVRPRLVKYTPDRAQRFQRQAIERLRAVPSVESVSMVGIGSVLSGAPETAALPSWPHGQQLGVRYNEVGPSYFATLRTPLLAGREFDDRDTTTSLPVAIVGASLAARLWPGRVPLGETIVLGTTARQVVGMVADASLNSRGEPADLCVFTPFWQNPGQIDSRIAIRTEGDPARLLPALVAAVHGVDADVPIAEAITLPARLAGLMRPLRVGAVFIGYAAALAVLLTAIGLYGTLAFAITRRTKEIGIRVALGAPRARLIRGIVGEGLRVVIAGAAAGLLLAVSTSRVTKTLLYGSPDSDWLFYAAAVAIVAGVGLAASALPARRAAAVEPIVALRQD